MAIDTPDVRGLDALLAIKACHPEVTVIFVTAAPNGKLSVPPSSVASGYILKPFSLDNVRNGLHQAGVFIAAGSPSPKNVPQKV